MSLRRSLGRSERGLDLTPMSDIIFTLLLFFILTQNFLTSLAVDLPRVHTGESLPDEQHITISLLASDVIVVKDRELPVPGWEAGLTDLMSGTSSATTVVLNAHRDARAGIAVEVIDRLRELGIRRVAFTAVPAASPKEMEPGAPHTLEDGTAP